MSLSHSGSHHQYRELHTSGGGGSGSGSGGGGSGSFPLSVNFFRSLPLPRRTRDALYAEAKQNARACLRLAFSNQWRYVPPEKDGAQVRKDTSNLTESRRLVRAAAVLRCQEHEVSQVLANTSSESWREFARKCCGKYLVDSLILHTVRSVSQPSSSSTRTVAAASRTTNEASGSDDDDESGRASHWQGSSSNNNHEHDNCRTPIRLVDDDCLSASGGATPKRLERRSSEVCAADMRARALQNRWTTSRRNNSTSNQDEGEPAAASPSSDPDGLGEDADELLTVKWGAFETGVWGRRDLCLVDYLSLAFMPTDDDDGEEEGAMEAVDASSTRESVHVWCFTSTDGDRVGCMQLRDTHGIKRASLSRFGVFWRRSSGCETEVVVCGSFPSKHAPAATAILLSCLSRLQSIVEDLRLGCQVYLPRSAWVNDRERSSCHLCMRNFFALRRKHHCRRCGEVVCSDCSTVESVDLPGIGYSKMRMCKVCSLRARSTPLRQVERENVFDRLVRVRRASGLARRSPRHSGSDSTLLLYAHSSRTSLSESKRSDRLDYSGSSSSGGSDNVPVSAAAMAHASRAHSSNQTSDDERCDLADSGASSLGGRATAATSGGAVVHPMPFAEPDDFIDAQCLKRQLTAMEAKKEQQQQQQQQQQEQLDKGGDMFDLLCELACQTLSCPIASVSIVDDRGQYIRSAAGLEGSPELDRELSVFLDKVMGSTPAIVLDANLDAQVRLAFPPQAPPAIRFFAGSPIYSRTGRKLGYVCVADTTKRDTLGASCAFTMERLASLAVTTMERNVSTRHASGASGSNQASDERQNARFMAAKSPGLASDVEVVDSELVYDMAPAKGVAAAAHAPPSDCHAIVGDAQERMRKLLLKSYHTQQQLAASNSPKVRLTPPF